MRKLIQRAISFLLCAVLLCPAVYAAETASAIELTKTTGSVTVSKSNGKALTLRDGMRLYNGYNVTTGADSYAWISLDSTKLMKLDASGSVEVRKNGSKLEVNVKSGTVSFDVSEKLNSGESLNISTSTMSVGIRGTCGWARVTDQWESEICLLEGTSICVVADPVSGQMKSAVLHGGDVARCVVYPKERPGDKCDILMERQTTGGIPGFVLTELVQNVPLCDRILDDSGIDVLADLAKEAGGDPSGRTPDGKSASPEVLGQAERVQGREEAETAQKLEEIQKEADSQESSISKDPVWEQGQQPSSGGGSGGGSAPTTYTVTFDYGDGTTETQTTDAAGKLVSPLPDGADNIDGDGAFQWFTSPTGGDEVTPDTVFTSNQTVYARWDGSWMFNKTSGHLTVFSDMGMLSRDAKWADYQTDIKTVEIRPEVTYVAGSAFQGCTGLTGVSIPEGVTQIAGSAFSGCRSLTDISIPGTVSSIGGYAFLNCTSLTSVTVPDSVLSIGGSAFQGCTDLTGVTLGSGVDAINMATFYGCSSLTSVTFPENMTTIGEAAFYRCSSLTRLDVPGSVTGIGPDAFTQSGLTDIYFDGTRAKWNAANPGNRANVPTLCAVHCTDDVTVSFDLNEMPWVDAPAPVIADADGHITRPTVGDEYGYLTPPETYHGTESWSFTGWYTDPTGGDYIMADTVFTSDQTVYAHWRCNSVEGSTVYFSGKGAMISFDYGVSHNGTPRKWSNCTQAVINDGVTNVGAFAFSECTSLKSVTIAEGVTKIDYYAFEFCSALTELTIPASLTEINGNAFYSCSNLKDIYYGGTMDQLRNISGSGNLPIGSTVHCQDGDIPCVVTFDTNGGALDASETTATTKRTDNTLSSLPTPERNASPDENAAYAFAGWFTERDGGEQVTTGTVFTKNTTVYAHWDRISWTLTDGELRVSGEGAMADSPRWGKSMTGAVIDSGITSIGSYAFQSCKSLSRVTIPEGVTVIGYQAFYECTALTGIALPESLTEIDNQAFILSGLTSVTIPDKVERIGSYAFQSCESLTSVTLPAGIKIINVRAFDSCESLTEIHYGGTTAQWNSVTKSTNAIPGGVTIRCSDGEITT